MKYTTAVALLAMVCAGTYAQEYSTFSGYSSDKVYSISPIYKHRHQLSSALAIEAQHFVSYRQSVSTAISPLYMSPAVPTMVMGSGKEHATRKKAIGISMVCLGVALQVGGALVLKKWHDDAQEIERNHRPGEKYYTNDGLAFLGVVGVLGGFRVAIPGTVIWIKGARMQKLYKGYPSMPQSSLSFQLGVNPSVCYRF